MYGVQDVLLGYAKAYARAFAREPLPLFYSCNIEYRPENPERVTALMQDGKSTAEEWADPYTVKRRGWGDCDDMVLWRVAEVLHRNKWQDGRELPCWPAVAQQLDTENYHVVVSHRGKFEDPARIMEERLGRKH
jgi:hypothetical protein